MSTDLISYIMRNKLDIINIINRFILKNYQT